MIPFYVRECSPKILKLTFAIMTMLGLSSPLFIYTDNTKPKKQTPELWQHLIWDCKTARMSVDCFWVKQRLDMTKGGLAKTPFKPFLPSIFLTIHLPIKWRIESSRSLQTLWTCLVMIIWRPTKSPLLVSGHETKNFIIMCNMAQLCTPK